MQCTNPFFLKKEGFFVPCGKCLACRINKSQEWQMRLLHELEYYDKALFVTLTYNDENLPCPPCVNKRALQLFFKRYRKAISPIKIKYFAAGEYGDKSYRPHYHIIIFGADLAHRYTIESCWPFGFVHVGSVNYNSIGYVTQYVTKKLKGSMEKYSVLGLTPPFQLQSLGFGERYVYDNFFTLINDKYLKKGKARLPLSRYYKQKLGLTGKDFEDIIRENSFREAEKILKNYPFLEDILTSMTYKLTDILPQRRRTLEKKYSMKKRNKI